MTGLNKLYIGTNTKMFKTSSQAVEHIKTLIELTDDIKDELNLFVLPSYTTLPAAVDAARYSKLRVGAQNMGYEKEGQFTGEISPLMLKELGIDLTMVGHSERRHTFHETDYDERRKVACALKNGISALLCIGETMEQKEYGISVESLRKQLKIGLKDVSLDQVKDILVAYEPVWAIGVNGIPSDERYADDMHKVIKDTLAELFGEAGRGVPVLYGGSVNNENAVKLISKPHIDGLFIGRSAWDAVNFNSIIRSVLPIFNEKRRLYLGNNANAFA